MNCNNCVHKCNVDRDISFGVCGCSNTVHVNKTMLHQWEEPCFSCKNGAGAVFFTGCNMNCIFCQNFKLHDGTNGVAYSSEQMSDLFLELQDNGADNIDLVTPTPHLGTIIPALRLSRRSGLSIPVIYNTSGSETPESIRSLEGLVDIYLPDFKYVSSSLSARFSGCKNYYPNIIEVLQEMYKQVGTLYIDETGMAKKGLLIRHMVLPCCVHDSCDVLESIHNILPLETYLSIMRQYTPTESVSDIKPLNRRITDREYNRVLQYATDLGFYHIYIQDNESASTSYIPDFIH